MSENEIIVISSDEESVTDVSFPKTYEHVGENLSAAIRTNNINVNFNALNIHEINTNSCNIHHKIGNVQFNIRVSSSKLEDLKNSNITESQYLGKREFGGEFQNNENSSEQETNKITNQICSKRELCESDNPTNVTKTVVESEPVEKRNLNNEKVSKENSESAVASSNKKYIKIVPVESHNNDLPISNKTLPCCSKSLHSSNTEVNELITDKCNQAAVTDRLPENLKNNEVAKYKMSCTFKKFLELVLSVEKNENDRAKLRYKIIKYHNLTDPNFLKSLKFEGILEKNIAKTKANPSAVYFIIKEVLDILLAKRTIKKKLISKKVSCEDNSQCNGNKDPEEDVYFDGNDMNHRIIKKLTKRLEQLGKRIKELEEEEVDFSEEENSNYLKMQRYRERFCQIYMKLCKYTNKIPDANRIYRRKIHFSGTKFTSLNENIEKWLNEIKIFPDFSDVLKFTEEQNTILSLKLSKEQIQTLAVDVFSDVGNMLQRLRKQDLWDSFSSYLGDGMDPALKNVELNNELKKSYKLGVQKERELINYYAEKQEREHLQPTEVPDEIANISTESSEEDDKEIEEIDKISDNFGEFENMSKKESSTKDDLLICESKKNEGNIEDNEVEIEEQSTDVIDDVQISSIKPEVSSTAITKSDSTRNKSYLVSLSLNNVIALLNNVKRNENKKLHEDETLNFPKKLKFSNSNDEDSESDCEITKIISLSKKSECEKKPLNIQKRRFHQINYAFINKCFSHNTILYGEDISRKKSNYWFNFRIEKISGSFPFADLTNSKNVSKINLNFSGIEGKRKKAIHTIKSKYLNKRRRFEKFNFKISNFEKMSSQCALQKGSKEQKINDPVQANEIKNNNDKFKKKTGNKTAKTPLKEGLNGGNGQNNNDNNENKKPIDRKKIAEDEQDFKEEVDKPKQNSESVIGDEITIVNSITDDARVNCLYEEINSEEFKLSAAILDHKVLSRNLWHNRNSGISKSLYNFFNINFENDNFSLLPEIKALLESTLIDRRETTMTNGTFEMQETIQKSKIITKDIRNVPMTDFTNELAIPDVKIPTPEMKDKNSEELREKPQKPEAFQIISDCDIEIISDCDKSSKAMKRKFPESVRGCHEESSSIVLKKQAKSKSKATSDDEIIKNFLQNSPSSLSITKPKRRDATSKIVEALASLSRLKNISTTIIKTSSKVKNEEDVIVVEESFNSKTIKPLGDSSFSIPSRKEGEDFLIPKIVTVRGNVTDFEKISNESIIQAPFGHNEEIHEPWHQETSNANDNVQNDFMETFDTPIKSNHQHSRFRIIKCTSNKKEIDNNVEYVVLD